MHKFTQICNSISGHFYNRLIFSRADHLPSHPIRLLEVLATDYNYQSATRDQHFLFEKMNLVNIN